MIFVGDQGVNKISRHLALTLIRGKAGDHDPSLYGIRSFPDPLEGILTRCGDLAPTVGNLNAILGLFRIGLFRGIFDYKDFLLYTYHYRYQDTYIFWSGPGSSARAGSGGAQVGNSCSFSNR